MINNCRGGRLALSFRVKVSAPSFELARAVIHAPLQGHLAGNRRWQIVRRERYRVVCQFQDGRYVTQATEWPATD
jgi:hypothetical protein